MSQLNGLQEENVSSLWIKEKRCPSITEFIPEFGFDKYPQIPILRLSCVQKLKLDSNIGRSSTIDRYTVCADFG